MKCGTEILLDHKHIYIYIYIYIYCAGNTVNGNTHGNRAIFEGTSDRRQEARISRYLCLTDIMLTNVNKTTTTMSIPTD